MPINYSTGERRAEKIPCRELSEAVKSHTILTHHYQPGPQSTRVPSLHVCIGPRHIPLPLVFQVCGHGRAGCPLDLCLPVLYSAPCHGSCYPCWNPNLLQSRDLLPDVDGSHWFRHESCHPGLPGQGMASASHFQVGREIPISLHPEGGHLSLLLGYHSILFVSPIRGVRVFFLFVLKRYIGWIL